MTTLGTPARAAPMQSEFGRYLLASLAALALDVAVLHLAAAWMHYLLAASLGFGVGAGAIFGDLYNNWVQKDPNGPLTSSGGARFRRCEAVGAVGTGCNAADHRNSETNKVAATNPGDPRGYSEPTWAGGGSIPNVFAHLAIPQLGFRVKPIKNLQFRFSTAFTLTGFMFSFGLDFGLEFKKSSSAAAALLNSGMGER